MRPRTPRGASRTLSDFQRGGVSSRGSTLFKPDTNIDKVKGVVNTELENSDVKFNETSKKLVDRNSWVLPKDINPTKLIIPSRKIYHVWDKYGIEVTTDCIKNVPIVNHGMRPLINIPTFVKYNFESKEHESDNAWLFDLAADSASRPIGT